MADTYTGADLFLDALEGYGVTHLFGNPGTTELPVVQATGDREMEYVLALHEDPAVGAAAGYASARRYHAHEDDDVLPLGVVNLHVAPGLAHGLGNVYGAAFAGAPLLVTAGNYATSHQHEEPILGGDLPRMARQFTKWSAQVSDVSALPTMVRRAVRTALTPPMGPVFLELPLDVVTAETEESPERLGELPEAGRGDAAALDRAADVLAEADEPVLVLGDQVARAGPDAVDAAVSLAEETGARVHGEFLWTEVNFPVSHEQWAGSLPGAADGMAERLATDTVVLVGCSTNAPTLGYEGSITDEETTLVHAGPDARELGKNWPADLSIVGDAGSILSELAERSEGLISETERDRRLDLVNEAVERFGGGSDPESDDPRASKTDLSRALAAGTDDPLIVNEAITTSRPMRQQIPFERGELIGNKSGGLGYGLPASVGAAVAEGERERETGESKQVVGFVGDGSYLYYPNTLYTAARYDLDLAVVIADNRNYRILKDNTLRVLGGTESDHEFVGMDFEPAVDLVANAESHGATARLVEESSVDGIAAELERALDEDGPTVLDVPIHD